MKKINLTLIIAIITIVNVNAQTTFGVKAGVNFSSLTLSDSYYEDFKARTSMHFGAVAEIQISDKFSFQPELLYSSQGAKNEYLEDEDGYSEKFVYKLNYLTVPLMAKYYVAEGFSLEAGPQIAFLLSAKDDYTWQDDVWEEGDSGSDDIKEYFKNVDFGLNFGVGYKLDSGLNFGARYYLGLSNIEDEEDYDDEGADYDSDYWIKNNVFQISVGYTF